MSDPDRIVSRRAMLSAGLVGLAAVAVSTWAGGRRAAAQDGYPNRYIKLVVPWPPGGVTDTTGRILAQYLSAELGQSVVVENKGGASGTIGHSFVAQSAADGYTLLLATNSTYAMAPYLLERLPYDSATAFTPIGLVVQSPQILCAHPGFPAQDFAGFLQYLRAHQPDQTTFESAGPGSSSHLAAELLMSMAQLRMLHVPYRGGGPAVQALVAGEVNVGFVDAVIALPFANSGQLRMLGVSTGKRAPLAPDVPTIAEAGLPGFQSSTDVALLAPAGTPDPIIRRLHGALVAALQAPQVRDPLLAQGAILVGGSPEEFKTYVAQEQAKWGEVIRVRGIKAQ
jgi:tripartite-type tricarboxylate transporter receptor subunit TctC